MFSNSKIPYWNIFPCKWLQPFTQQGIINIEGLYEKTSCTFLWRTVLFDLHMKQMKIPFVQQYNTLNYTEDSHNKKFK